MLLSLTATLALSAAPCLLPVQGSITVDAGRGPLTVSLPAGYDANEPAPLILLLHGFGASGATQEAYMGFGAIQDQYGFVFCAPDGTVNGFGQRFWNATDACCNFQGSNVDDSAYLLALIEAIEAAASIDPRSIHLMGHSNGGFMAYRMACENSDKIASIATLAGATFNDPADCVAGGPVHVLQVHGTADTTIGFNGGAIFGNQYPGALETCQLWAMRNGCALTTTFEDEALNLVANLAGKETTKTFFPNDCSTGGSVELWTIEGGVHTPNLSPFFAPRIVEHLLAHPKPGVMPDRYCSPAAPNSSGAPAIMGATGSDVLADNALVLTASDLPLNAFGYFLNSQTEGLAMPPGSQGTLCLGGQIGRFSDSILNSGSTGAFSLEVDLTALPGNPTASAMIGDTWRFQAWFRDANPQQTSNLTDAIRLTVR